MKSLIIILLVLFSVCAAANPSSDFLAWMSKYGKSYANPTELAKRFNIFKANMKKIYEENLRANGSYTLALNAFSDMSQQEWASKYLLPSSKGRMTYNSTSNPGSTSSPGSYWLPSSVDWRKKGAVVGVKNQGQCGSCWAFATVAAVESINFIVTRRLISLSEQELLDCDTTSQGCNYGYQTSAMSFMVKNGVDSEAHYPYKFAPSGYCPLYKKRRVNIDDFRYVPSYDELALQTAVAQQPVSVYIDATYLQSYSSGIYTGPCSQTTGNHFLLIVGYGRTSQGTSYWIAKNSWGTSWGENGYIRFPRYMNKCNINREAIYPVKYS